MENKAPVDIKKYDEKLLSDFLTLIRDKYRLVDRANFFLEQQGITSIHIAITNQRDAISHFVSFLHTQEKEQLFAAEEHLRRGVLEPYQISLDILRNELYDHIQFLEEHTFHDKVNIEDIRKEIKEIESLYLVGRKSKNGNKWDDNLEIGVSSFIDGFNKATKLLNSVKEQVILIKHENEKMKKDTTSVNKPLMTIISLIIFVSGIALGLFL